MLADYDIREARGDDVPRLVDFRKAITDHSVAANNAFPRRSASAWARLSAQYEQWVEDDRVCVLVADHRATAQVVAMVIAHDIQSDSMEPGHVGEISDAWVEPEHRRGGIATLLAHRAAEFFVAAGVSRVQLDFAAGNVEAEGFWLGFGLEPVVIAVSGDPAHFLRATARDPEAREATGP